MFLGVQGLLARAALSSSVSVIHSSHEGLCMMSSHTVRPPQESCDKLQYLKLFRIGSIKGEKVQQMICNDVPI
jgi:hypothetical protein